MAAFSLRHHASHPSNRLGFVGGLHAAEFLTPEELGRSVVSPPLVLGVVGVEALREGAWAQLAAELEAQLVQGSEPGRYTRSGSFEVVEGVDKYRIIISSTSQVAALARSNEQGGHEGNPEVVRTPVKVKLISGIPRTAIQALREQGKLARLARFCGPQNVVFRITGLDAVSEENPSEELRLQLFWNEQELCWATAEPVQMSFKTADMNNFGRNNARLLIYLVGIEFELTDAGVAAVLQRQYGMHGENWRVQQQYLETGEFADMQIICEDAEAGNGNTMPIKCHRKDLAVSSPVFAKMLEEGQGRMKEAETRILKLPYSAESIQAMLHFLYYGGCDRIFGNRVDVILELLEAGEKYNIPNLVDVTTFVLLADAKEENWFTLDAAVELYHFVQNLEGEGWDKLKQRSVEMIQGRKKEERDASVGYQMFQELATKLGPVFLFMLEHAYHLGAPWNPVCFPSVDSSRISLEEANFMYKFLSYAPDFQNPRNVDVGFGLMVLADFCGKPIPDFAPIFQSAEFSEFAGRLWHYNLELSVIYRVDYLVELFCTARQKEGASWQKLKMETVKYLTRRMRCNPDKVSCSTKYRDMLKTPDVFEDFSRLRAMAEESFRCWLMANGFL